MIIEDVGTVLHLVRGSGRRDGEAMHGNKQM